MLIRATGPVVSEIYLLTLGRSCHYLVGDQESLTLIDPGLQCHIPALLTRIEQLGFSPDSIKNVLLTHLHADRAGGIPLLRKMLPQAQLSTSQAIMDKLAKPETIQHIYQEDADLTKLYPTIDDNPLEFEEYKRGFAISDVINDSMLIHVTPNTNIRPFSIVAHTDHSLGYFIEPQQYFVVDEGFGYFRPKSFAAPAADYSIQASIDLFEKLAHFEINGLCLPQSGILSGELGARHTKEVLQNTRDLVQEVENATKENYPVEHIKNSITSAFYQSDSPDPLLKHNMKRSLNAIWDQLQS